MLINHQITKHHVLCMYVVRFRYVTKREPGRNPTYPCTFSHFIKQGVRSLTNASRSRQFNPLNPPGVGWVPPPQTWSVVRGRAWSVMRARSCVVVRARSWSVVRGRACVVGHAWSCVVVRGRSCVVVRARSCVYDRSFVVVCGRARSVVRGRSCVVVPFCPLRGQHGSQHYRAARFAASTAVTRTIEGTNEQHLITPYTPWGGMGQFFLSY